MHVIINGVSSETLQGVQVLSLPPITKPRMRTSVAVIDGRPGDIVTRLGYEAYNRKIRILLHHDYDIDAISAFFNTSGTIIFSNEPDMEYEFETIDAFSFERAVRYKTADITFHVQPYKLSATEQPTTGEVSTLVDKTPYILRRTPFGTRQKGTIVGGSIVWNQLVKHGNFDEATGWQWVSATASVSDNIATMTPTSTTSKARRPFLRVLNHKYFAKCMINGTEGRGEVNIWGGHAFGSAPLNGAWVEVSGITNGILTCTSRIDFTVSQNTNMASWQVKDCMIIDLTLMFGPTIADYIYAQEQATAGTGVALAKAWAGIIADYSPYDEGSIKSVTGLTAHKTTGYNQWDEEWEVGSISGEDGQNIVASTQIRSKNYIPVIQGETYYICTAHQGGVFDGTLKFCLYDANKRFVESPATWYGNSTNKFFTVPEGVSYIRFIGTASSATGRGPSYIGDICINISDPAKNGTYEPYDGHVYPLDSSLTLRGLPKLDGDSISYNGDIYKADGTVERRYGVRAYQSGDESDATVLTDGTNTVYKLTNATTEQAEPYTELQVCDPNGTEEWVGANMPVGHETTYIDPISMTVTNEGNTTSAPSITIEGEGAVEATVDGLNILQIQMPASGEITIDSRTLDATDGEGGLANRSVTGDYNDLQLAPGEHTVTVTGDVTSVTLKNTSRWI